MNRELTALVEWLSESNLEVRKDRDDTLDFNVASCDCLSVVGGYYISEGSGRRRGRCSRDKGEGSGGRKGKETESTHFWLKSGLGGCKE